MKVYILIHIFQGCVEKVKVYVNQEKALKSRLDLLEECHLPVDDELLKELYEKGQPDDEVYLHETDLEIKELTNALIKGVDLG